MFYCSLHGRTPTSQIATIASMAAALRRASEALAVTIASSSWSTDSTESNCPPRCPNSSLAFCRCFTCRSEEGE